MQIPVVDVETLSRNWWAVLLRGIAAILFGAITFAAPGISLAALVLIFGVYALADGVLSLLSVLRPRARSWWVLLLRGCLGIAAGVGILAWPGITALMLLYVIAFWAVLAGVLEIAAAIRLRKVVTGEWLMVLSGILSIVLGLLLFASPGAGALVMMFWIGAYALVAGVLLVVLSLRLRARRKSHGHDAPPEMEPHPV
jgi:uncharacterized membrane protein HdeD (DUF308 family)